MPPAAELRGTVLPLPLLRVHEHDLAAVRRALESAVSGSSFFSHAPVVLDLSPLEEKVVPDFAALTALLRECRLIPVGVKEPPEAWREGILEAGLAIVEGGHEASPRTPSQTPPPAPSAPVPTPTLVVEQPVRSGQQIYARGGDLILLAAVNAGAEVIADGNIHVYAPLRGRALAGVQGNTSARIFVQTLEAELVAVAGVFRVFDEPGSNPCAGRSACIALRGEQLVIDELGRD